MLNILVILLRHGIHQDIVQFGTTPRSGRGNRGFKSHYPDTSHHLLTERTTPMTTPTLILNLTSYHNDALQSLLIESTDGNFSLPKLKSTNSIPVDVTKHIQQQFNVNLTDSQIIIRPAKPTVIPDTIIPVLIQITNDQAHTLDDYITNHAEYSWQKSQTLPGKITQSSKQIIDLDDQYLIDQYQVYRLQAIHHLLPPTFTTQSLSALLSNLTGDFIKYNNIHRTFFNQLKVVAKDRSKKGRPKTVFKYQLNNDKPKPRKKLSHDQSTTNTEPSKDSI